MNDAAERRVSRRALTGILLLDKPEGLSSNAALQRVKHAFGARKAGHTGSLDVLATGLLPICFGEATKVSAYLLDADKSYFAEVRLGIVTKTGDREGEIIHRSPGVDVTRADVERALGTLRGRIQQVPPMHSALKRDGQRLYKLAHKGIEIERAPRSVTIHYLEMLDLAGDRLAVEVTCSKGTYIRTLAEDIGSALGCGAHVESLRRTRSGPFSLADACTLETIRALADSPGAYSELDALLLPSDAALVELPDIHLTEESAHSVSRGQAVRIADAPRQGLVRLYRPHHEFLGVGAILEDGRVTPRRLMC